MKQRYFPYLIGAGLLVSGSIITGLANADMGDASHKRAKFMAKKLDINNDGLISLEELTSRQDKRFQKLDRNGDGMIDKTEFNGRIVAIRNPATKDTDALRASAQIPTWVPGTPDIMPIMRQFESYRN